MKYFILPVLFVITLLAVFSCSKNTVQQPALPTPNATQTHLASLFTHTCSPTSTETSTITVTVTPSPTITSTSTPQCTTVMGYNVATTQSWGGGWYAANSFTAPSSTTVNTLKAVVGSNCGGPVSGTISLALYTNVAGYPYLLQASATGLSYSSGDTVSASIPPVTLTAGTVYWLVSIASSCGVNAYATGAGGAGDTLYIDYGWTNFTGFPANASTLSWTTSYGSFQNIMSAENCQ